MTQAVVRRQTALEADEVVNSSEDSGTAAAVAALANGSGKAAAVAAMGNHYDLQNAID